MPSPPKEAGAQPLANPAQPPPPQVRLGHDRLQGRHAQPPPAQQGTAGNGNTARNNQAKPAQPAPPVKQAQPLVKSPSQVPSPNLVPLPAPSPPQQTPAPALTKPAETVAQAPAAGVSADGPMMVGGPAQAIDPSAKPLVKSAAEKALTKKIDDSALGAVLSLGANVPPRPGTYRQQEILAGNLSQAARNRVVQLGYEVREGSVSRLTSIHLPPKLDAWEIARGLAEEFPNQGFALNYLYQPYRYAFEDTAIIAKVPLRPSVGCSTERCYGRRAIGWNDQAAACAAGVRVGVIDTGFDAEHPAFARGKKPTIVMAPKDPAARAPDWHGTGVLALLAGSATSSTPGLIPDAEFLIADAFFAVGGKPRTDTMHLLEALHRLNESGAQVINMSLVGPNDDVLHDRITYLSKRKGVVFIAAAGNGGPTAPPGYPAAYPEVIAVTAVDGEGKSYPDANHGGYISVAAPGVRIWTALPGNQEGLVSGTSFAAPFVTAVAAMTYNQSPLKALISAKHTSLDPKEVMLAGFTIDKVADGESKLQRETYGRGLVKAPGGNCAPQEPPKPWVAKVTPRVAPPAAWLTDVRRASLQ